MPDDVEYRAYYMGAPFESKDVVLLITTLLLSATDFVFRNVHKKL